MSRLCRTFRVARATIATVLALAACERRPDLDEVFEPPRPINQVGARNASTTAFELAPDSYVTFSLGARRRRAAGRLRVVHSQLELNPDDLAATRGRFTVDLSTIEVEEWAEVDQPAPGAPSLTEQSLRWLEVPRAEADGAEDRRFARLTIRHVGELSARAAVEGRPLRRPEPGRVLRRVDFKVTGELTLHGYRIEYTVPIRATFHLPEPARAGQEPTRIELGTREPLRLDLTQHDVLPRDARGSAVASSLVELKKGAGQVARISLRWDAVPSAGQRRLR